MCASLMAQMVKNLPAIQETWVRLLGWKDPLEMGWKDGSDYPLQYSCLENSMDRGAWRATVHGVAKSQTRHSGYDYDYYFLCVGWTVSSGQPLKS